jgi:hypothetical protein
MAEFKIFKDGRITKGDNPAFCVNNQATFKPAKISGELLADRAFSCNAFCVACEIGKPIELIINNETPSGGSVTKPPENTVEIFFHCCKRKAIAEMVEEKSKLKKA